MAKRLTEDEIRWILSLDASEAEREANKLSKESARLTERNKELRQSMLRLEAQGKKNSDNYRTLSDEYARNGEKLQKNRAELKRLDEQMGLANLTMTQLRRRARDLQRQLDGTSQALHPEDWSRLNAELTKTRQRMAELKNSAGQIEEQMERSAQKAGRWSAVYGKLVDWATGAADRLKEVAVEGVRMAESFDGVSRAFSRLDTDGTLLQSLREATRGTVSDLELMKNAVLGSDLQIPLQDIGKYLQFAQLKAQQTGQSVDYLAQSIITGLGRRSVEILDNLGLSTVRIREETEKTGDFMKAVAAIVDEELASSAANYVSASDRAQQAAVRFQNAQRELGETLLPLKRNWDEVYTDLSVGTMELIGWAVKHRDVLLAAVTAVTTYAAATKAAKAAQQAYNTVTRSSITLTTLFNKVLKRNPWGLVISAVTTAIAYFTTFCDTTDEVTEAQRRMNDELDRTKETLDRVSGVKLKAENMDLLTPRQRQRLKEDTKRGIAELEDLISREMIKERKWYESERERLMKEAGENETLQRSYLRGLEHDLKERMKVIAGYVEEKKRLEKIAASIPDGGAATVPGTAVTSSSGSTPSGGSREDLKAEAEREARAVVDTEKAAAQSLRDLREEELTARRKWLDDSRAALMESLNAGKISREQHEMMTLELEKEYAGEMLRIERAYYDDSMSMALTDTETKEALVRESAGRVAEAEKAANAARLAEQAKLSALVKDFKQQFKLTTVDEDYQAQLAVLEASYRARREMAEKNRLDTAELDKAYYRAKEQLESDHQRRLQSIRSQYGLASQQKKYAMELEQLKAALDQQLLTQEEYERAVQNLKRDSYKTQFDYYSNLFSGAVEALQQAEMANVDAKYDAEIEAAEGNSEEVERLENEKAEKKLEIQKKYADVNFAITVSQIIADTATAVMKAFADLGPIAGAVAAALMTATGAAQIAAANAERQKVKNMTLSGSDGSSSQSYERVVTGKESGGRIDVVREQDGKLFPGADYDPDRRGFVDRPTVIVGEGPRGRSKEWVASNAAVENPTVAPILDIIDRSQQAGTIRTLDLNRVIQARMAGYAGGGAVDAPSSASPSPRTLSPERAVSSTTMERLAAVLERLERDGIPATVALSELERKRQLRDRGRKIGSKS